MDTVDRQAAGDLVAEFVAHKERARSLMADIEASKDRFDEARRHAGSGVGFADWVHGEPVEGIDGGERERCVERIRECMAAAQGMRRVAESFRAMGIHVS